MILADASLPTDPGGIAALSAVVGALVLVSKTLYSNLREEAANARADRDAWKSAWHGEHEARLKAEITSEAALETGKTAVQLITALREASNK